MTKNVIEKIKTLESEKSSWNVASESMGFILRIAKIVGCKNILEIGTYNGYSALKLSLVTDKLITLERDEIFIKEAEKNLKIARNIKLIKGDALKTLKDKVIRNDSYDLIFIDAMKPEYQGYFLIVKNMLSNGGVIIFDNTISHRKKIGETFFKEIKDSNFEINEFSYGDGLIVLSKNKIKFSPKDLKHKYNG